MRVIGGRARGRRIVAPDLESVRPTADRVREAIFDVLGSLGAVEGATVLDLFAGSGALGIEAISRGAHHATFVESDRRAIATISQNLAVLGFDGPELSNVVMADAQAFCRRSTGHFDLVLCDPPYAFDAWSALLERIPGSVVVAESSVELELPIGVELHRVYRYGTTLVTVARRSARDDVSRLDGDG